MFYWTSGQLVHEFIARTRCEPGSHWLAINLFKLYFQTTRPATSDNLIFLHYFLGQVMEQADGQPDFKRLSLFKTMCYPEANVKDCAWAITGTHTLQSVTQRCKHYCLHYTYDGSTSPDEEFF